jgi:hypothetical protein
VNWPANMIEKPLLDGSTGYYWNPHTRYLRAGFPLTREALGRDYAHAITRATELNRHLDDWRRGRDAVKDLDHQPGFATLEWAVERYKRSRAWEKVSKRSRYEVPASYFRVRELGEPRRSTTFGRSRGGIRRPSGSNKGPQSKEPSAQRKRGQHGQLRAGSSASTEVCSIP